MAIASMAEMIEAGIHFGSAAARWNPKMKPYIFAKQNKIHIIDLKQTLTGLIKAWYFLEQISAQGKNVLFVGTKRQATDIVRQEAKRSDAYYVCNRWLGGTLTNMNTMRKRINRLKELEDLENSGKIQEFSKKMISALSREKKKIFRNFEGIRNMKDMPGAIVVVDPAVEHIAVAEAVKLGIPLIGIIDTDDDPSKLDFVIPANDDSFRSIQYLLSRLVDAIIEGKKKNAVHGTMQQRAQATNKNRAERKNDSNEKNTLKTPEDFSKIGGFSYGGDNEE